MKKHKFLKTLIVCTIFVVVFIFVCFAACTIKYGSKKKTVYLKDGSSFASNWVYEMSEQDILKEREHQYLYALVGGDYQYWEFEAVGEGEVTIEYTAQYQLEVVEEKCFSVTYYVDEDGTITEISSHNKPTEYDDIPNNPLKVFAIRVGDFLFKIIMSIVIFFLELSGLG